MARPGRPLTVSLDRPPLQAQWRLGRPHDAWRVIVVTRLVNSTRERAAAMAIKHVFERCPSPEAMATERGEMVLRELLHPLGMSQVRASGLRKMSALVALIDDLVGRKTAEGYSGFDQLVMLGLVDIESVPGCGRFAVDAVELFFRGNLEHEPEDEAFAIWRRLMRERTVESP